MSKESKITRRQFIRDAAVIGAGVAGASVIGSTINPTTVLAQVPAKWDKEADVIVIGSGAAGMPAAVTAVQAGASVILVEKNFECGGNAGISQGSLSVSGGSKLQKAAGFDDSPDKQYKTLMDFKIRENRRNDPALARAYVDRGPEVVDWLAANGVKLAASATGHTIIWDKEGPGWLYGTNPAGKASGAGMIKPLEAVAKAKGVDIQLKCEMTKLIREGGRTGRVVGVVVSQGGATLNFHAKKAVVIAAGSWKGGKFLRTLFDPRMTADLVGTGEPYVVCDGLPIQAAVDIGSIITSDRANDAHVWHRMFGTKVYRFSPGQPYGKPGIGNLGQLAGTDMASIIFVNKAGLRFVNEDAGEAANGFYDYALAQDGRIIWTIFDDEAAKKKNWVPTDATVEKGMAFSASTLADLAKAINVPADALTSTVTKYNSFVDAGADTEFKKDKTFLTTKIATAPFYAVAVSLQVHDTMGGLPINAKAQVLDLWGKVIPGLYAAGEAAGGLDVIGMPKGVVMGRIAGEAAAAEKPAT